MNVDFNYIVSFIGVFLFAFFKLVPSLNRFMGSAQNMRYNNVSVTLALQAQGNLLKRIKSKKKEKEETKEKYILSRIQINQKSIWRGEGFRRRHYQNKPINRREEQ